MRTITKFGGLVRYPYRSEGRTVTRNYNRDQYGLCTIPKVVLLRRCAYEGPVRILDHYDKYMIRTVTKSLPVQKEPKRAPSQYQYKIADNCPSTSL